jgi:hypothetical protein
MHAIDPTPAITNLRAPRLYRLCTDHSFMIRNNNDGAVKAGDY